MRTTPDRDRPGNGAVLHVLALLASTLAVWGLVNPAQAQDDVSTQIWLDYNPRWTWPSGLNLYGDLGVRTELNQSGWGRIVVRPGLRGPIGKGFELSGGIGGFYTFNELTSDRLEIRPFQGVRATWPSKPLGRVATRFALAVDRARGRVLDGYRRGWPVRREGSHRVGR